MNNRDKHKNKSSKDRKEKVSEKKEEPTKSALEIFLGKGDASDEFDPLLSIQDMAILAQVSKNLNTMYQPLVEPTIEAKQLTAIAKYILDNDSLEAIELLKSRPHLIFSYVSEVKNEFGDTYQHVSPFQLAWDTRNDFLCEEMTDILNQLPNGKEEAIRQLNEWFSETKLEKPTFDYDFTDLVNALKLEDFANVYRINPNTQAAIDIFQNDFSAGIIKNEYHFNIQILLKALDIYNKHFKETIYEHIYTKNVLIYLWQHLPSKDKLAFPPEKIFRSNTHGFFDFQPTLKRSSLITEIKKYCHKTQNHLDSIKKDLCKKPKKL